MALPEKGGSVVKKLYLVTGIALIILGLLLAVVEPFAGIVFAAIGFVFIRMRKKLVRGKNDKWRFGTEKETITKARSSTTLQNKNPAKPARPNATVPSSFGGYKIAYHYKDNGIAMPNMENCMAVKIGTELPLVPEPDNEYDNRAIKIMAGDQFLGYVYKGQIQDMIHDFTERNEVIYAAFQGVEDETEKPSMVIAFYQNPFEKYARYDSIKATLTKTSKKIDGFENRQDNFFAVERGNTLELEYDDETETYIVTNDMGNELGEISKSVSAKIQEREDTDEPICIVDEVTETDDGKYGAKVIIYFK